MLYRHFIAGISLAAYYAFARSTSPELDLEARSFAVCVQIKYETSATWVYYPDDLLGHYDVDMSYWQGFSSHFAMYYPGDLVDHYNTDISHWASSSTQFAKCSVRPGTAEDVAKILQIVGSTQTPFAVKGGGHATNPRFSSTTGIQISMKLFSEVTYDSESQTAVIGAGLIWDDVYAALAPYGVTVLGGRVTGIGVAGFTLGGGYSWLTNQHGLTIDTVVAFELVKPNGDIVNVTESSDPNLFFGLKGGMNNFGIVTRFTLKTFPQGHVWAGSITYTSNHILKISAATAKFCSTVTDPKAAILTSYNALLGQPIILQVIFYDGLEPPAGIFDDFLAIPHLTNDVSTRDFLSFVKSMPANATYGQRGIFQSVSLTEYTPTLLDAVYNETAFWGSRLTSLGGFSISYMVEPFLPTLFTHGSASAYPPSRDKGLSPFVIYFAWTTPLSDNVFHEVVKQSAAQIKAVAIAEGQDVTDAAIYPNYAIYDTPLEGLYGSNVPMLQALKASVDPTNVMGLAGGFKL